MHFQQGMKDIKQDL